MASRHPTDPFNDGSLLESWVFDATYESQQARVNPFVPTAGVSLETGGSQSNYGHLAIPTGESIMSAEGWLADGAHDATVLFAIYREANVASEITVSWGEEATRYNLELYVNIATNGYLIPKFYAHKQAVVVSVTGILVDTGWHYVFGTFDSTTLTLSLYVDKIFKGDTTGPTMLFNDTQSVEAHATVGTPLVTDIQYYNKVLTPDEMGNIIDDTWPNVVVEPDVITLTVFPNELGFLDANVLAEATDISIVAPEVLVMTGLFYTHIPIVSPQLAVMEANVWPDESAIAITVPEVFVPEPTVVQDRYPASPMMIVCPRVDVVSDRTFLSIVALPISMVPIIHLNYTHLRIYVPPVEVSTSFVTDNTRTDIDVTPLDAS